MVEARTDFGVYCSENRIYLIAGWTSTSIEYYDIDMNRFNIIPDLVVPKGGVVSVLFDQSIYLIGKNLSVMNRDFEVEESANGIYQYYPHCFSDMIVKEDKVIFINSGYTKVVTFDLATRSIRDISLT